MAITAERATSSERAIVDDLFRAKFAEEGTDRDPEAVAKWATWIHKYFADSNCIPFLIRLEGESVGFAIAKLDRTPTGPDGRTPAKAHFIEEFFVLPQHRRKGIGTRAAEIILREYPGRWMTTTWPGGPAVGFWRHVATRRPSVSGREYGPDEHKGFPGQHVWVFESLTGEGAEPARDC